MTDQDSAGGRGGMPLGRYECEGQVPIIVEKNGFPAGSELHGPWISYRFEWDPPGSAQPVLFTSFRALLELGYKHVPGAEP